MSTSFIPTPAKCILPPSKFPQPTTTPDTTKEIVYFLFLSGYVKITLLKKQMILNSRIEWVGLGETS